MPATFRVAAHDAKPIAIQEHPPKTAEDFLQASCYVYNQLRRTCSEEVLQSSVTESVLPTLRAQKNGFVHTVIEAYGQHHHLRIRPDDVWIAILSQLSFYINKHAERLRNHFVAHEGKKELRVQTVGTRYTVDFGRLAVQMSSKVHENVVDKTLVEWVLPNFTTSTPQDVTVCSVLLMSTLQKYFGFVMGLICGIPSVTLEGEKEDWEKLYKRIDRLPELGTEPEQWAAMLRPILRRFVDAFDGNPDVAFWEHVVYRNNKLCGRDGLSGWITAFCVWDVDGNWLARNRNVGAANSESTGSVMTPHPTQSYSDPYYTLDGVPYFSLDMKDIPAGYSEVDVLVDDNGEELECRMVSGHLASAVSKAAEDGPFDTLSPAPQWFIYVKAPPDSKPAKRGNGQVQDP
ncbi:hypothetical protein GSI_01476 [Ganoderma sinense ZZ0214-1]|uniref:Uncharacterized protein n=1 Tax=Ganoderma sinense ZZ0214-1 TaxID=1077348 RepID=A0A2G8SPX2_9APHY|nr:hypothetical protein GSI_01476 [Ganoderma sinense ZZ0214-1]